MHLFWLSVYRWKPLCANIPTWMAKWDEEGGKGVAGGGRAMSVRWKGRRCGTEWLIVTSRHPRVLVEWIKGWKKEWKPFHAFTDQSQDHVPRVPSLRLLAYTVHASPCHLFYHPDSCVCRVDVAEIKSANFARKGLLALRGFCRRYQFFFKDF